MMILKTGQRVVEFEEEAKKKEGILIPKNPEEA